jgi:hypothetical protein
MSDVVPAPTVTDIDHSPDVNRNILPSEDIARVAECNGNLANLNRKLENVNAHIKHFREQINALYNDNPYLLYSVESRDMMCPKNWAEKFKQITAKKKAFDMAKLDYNRNLEPLQKQLNEKMADVKKKAKLRDKLPNYDNPVITGLNARISELEKSNPEANNLTDNESTFLWSCKTYQEYRRHSIISPPSGVGL